MDVIKRIRTHPAIMVYGVYLYFSARSYRFASKCLEPIVKRSYVSLWKWVQRFAEYADRFNPDKHYVKCILVDETLVKVKEKRRILAMDSIRAKSERMPDDAPLSRKDIVCMLRFPEETKEEVW